MHDPEVTGLPLSPSQIKFQVIHSINDKPPTPAATTVNNPMVCRHNPSDSGVNEKFQINSTVAFREFCTALE